jgi:hypothetical protein
MLVQKALDTLLLFRRDGHSSGRNAIQLGGELKRPVVGIRLEVIE